MNLLLEKEKIKNDIDEIKDVRLLKAIREMLSFAQQQAAEKHLKPFTQKQLLQRARKSQADIANGRTTTTKQLRKEVAKW